jgi:hypothetical protein
MAWARGGRSEPIPPVLRERFLGPVGCVGRGVRGGASGGRGGAIGESEKPRVRPESGIRP